MNACVACVSAKHFNPDDDVALAVNFSEKDVGESFRRILKKNRIKIFEIPYDSFVFSEDYKWSLAFYKLCVLKAISKMDYQNICYLDSDVYVQGSFLPIWQQCTKDIVMYDLSHGCGESFIDGFQKEVEVLIGVTTTYPTHYGGEFFAASASNARLFCGECEEVYKKIIETGFKTQYGDEFILSTAAMKFKSQIGNAAKYIFRFWTGSSYRLISTVYKTGGIRVIHVPAEKKRGMITLFEKYIKQGKIPSVNAVWKTFRLEALSPIEQGKILVAKMVNQRKT